MIDGICAAYVAHPSRRGCVADEIAGYLLQMMPDDAPASP
jgi:hypothetical protein